MGRVRGSTDRVCVRVGGPIDFLAHVKAAREETLHPQPPSAPFDLPRPPPTFLSTFLPPPFFPSLSSNALRVPSAANVLISSCFSNLPPRWDIEMGRFVGSFFRVVDETLGPIRLEMDWIRVIFFFFFFGKEVFL